MYCRQQPLLDLKITNIGEKKSRSTRFLKFKTNTIEANVGASTGSEIVVFKKFKKHLPKIQQDTFLNGLTYPRFSEILGGKGDNILRLANEKILEDFPRNDYKD